MSIPIKISSTFLPVEALPLTFHRAALDYWNGLRGDRWAPSWREFSLMALPADMIPFVNVTDITPVPLASRYRFWGTGLTTAFGGDYTGRSPIDVPPKSVGLSAKGGCGRLVSEKAPHCEVKQYETLQGYRGRVVVLRLPCSDDGAAVTNGIGIYKFEHVNPDAELTAFFEEVFGPLGYLPYERS